jgi:hypothetical protein
MVNRNFLFGMFFLIVTPVVAMKRSSSDLIDTPALKRHKITHEFRMEDLRVSEHEKREFNDKICGDFQSKLLYALSSGDFFKATLYVGRMNTRDDFDSNAIMADISMSDKWDQNEQIALFNLLPRADFTEPVEYTNGSTPLHIAVQKNRMAVVSYLLKEKKINPRLEDGNGCEPILFAKSAQVANILSTKGAMLNVIDTFGATPLHLSDNKELTQYLLVNGLDSNQTDNKERTPLFGSAGLDQSDNAAELMAGGADYEKKDYKGETAYERREKKYHDANPVVMNTRARQKAIETFAQKNSNITSFVYRRERAADEKLQHLRITR